MIVLTVQHRCVLMFHHRGF